MSIVAVNDVADAAGLIQLVRRDSVYGRFPSLVEESPAACWSDVIGSPASPIFDSQLTTVVDGTQVTVASWYDNEWCYACRMLEMCERVLAHAGTAVPR